MCILSLLYILLCDFFATAQHYGFVYPNATNPTQQNLVLEVGEEIDIRWSSPFPSIKLAVISEESNLFHVFSRMLHFQAPAPELHLAAGIPCPRKLADEMHREQHWNPPYMVCQCQQ